VESLLSELGAHGTGGVNPDEAQLRALLEADRAGPLQFVNLLAYRERAVYPEGHELAREGLSGSEAYGRYGAVALGHVMRRGGSLVLYNDVCQVLIGQTGRWDQIAVMQYPDTAAFVDMIRDPDYRSGLVHRDAGLADTVILVSRSLLSG
jgi:uncharacterized protein (DUF1330 family)